MPRDKISYRVKRPSTGIGARRQKDAGRGQGSRSRRVPNNVVDNDALKHSLLKWQGRERDGDYQSLAKLKNMSTSVRYGKGMKRKVGGHKRVYNPAETKIVHDQEVKDLLKSASDDLNNALETGDRGAEFLARGYIGVLSTLQDYADRSVSSRDVKARVKGFTNLRLFLKHGGDLHSTSRGDKLQRTVARIPEKVLKNASDTVTFDDYAAADYLKQRKGQLPLLSFHGYKATGNWFSKGKHSQVYREKLRAITASAKLLGGVNKAVKVKELLRQINEFESTVKGNKKEDIVDRILQSLGKHANPDTLINELNFELQRRRVAEDFKIKANLTGVGVGKAHPDAANVSKELQKLDGLPNRVTIFENLNTAIKAKEDGYTSDQPRNLLNDLVFITQPGDPVANILKLSQGDGTAAQYAIYAWADLMAAEGSAVRVDVQSEIDKIDKLNGPEKLPDIYLSVAQAFASVDKTHMSVGDQYALLLRCLKDHSAGQSKSLGTGDLGSDIKDDINDDDDSKDDIKVEIAVGNSGGVGSGIEKSRPDSPGVPKHNIVSESGTDDEDKL